MKPEQAEDAIGEIRDIFEPMIEAGAFVGHQDVADEIANLLGTAGRLVEDKALPEASAVWLIAEALLNDRVRSKSWWWRIWHLHALPLFLYHIACIVGVILLWKPLSSSNLFLAPTSSFLLGVLGSELRGIYWLQVQVAKRIFRPTNVLAHIASPFIGALLALIAYLLTKLGVFALLAAEKAAPQTQEDLVPLTVAFLSGFKWEWVLKKLEQLFTGGGSPGK